MLQLQIVGSPKQPIWLVNKRTTIGSAPDCDLVLPDGSSQPLHAEIILDGDQLYLVPLHRMLCDGVEVTQSVVIAHGLHFMVGESLLAVIDPKLDRVQQDSSKWEGDGTEAATQWSLVSVSAALAGKRYWVGNNDVIGRSRDCEISLAVNHLSRRHARFSGGEEELVVEDLASANGTFVNGERIQKKRLWHGDEVRFDALTFRVLAPGRDDSVEDENDRTSLRPSVSLVPTNNDFKQRQPATPLSKKPASAPRTVPSIRPSSDTPSTTRTQGTSNHQGSSQGLAFGLAIVLVVTAAVIIYLRS